MKKLIATFGVIATLAAAVPAMAQSVVPVYTTGYGTGYSTGSVSGYAQPFCPTLSYNLYRGLSDYYTQGQVTALQQYYTTLGYYQPVTGYFGQLTYANTVRYQQTYRIYPVTGGVGPITRSVIVQNCGGIGYNPGTGLYASPTSGQAPLTVTFSTAQTPGGYWAIQFGDGQSANSLMGPVTHTYTQPGTYTATAMSDLPCLHTTPQCYTFVAQQNLGSATVVVTSQPSVGGVTVSSPTAGQIYTRGQDMTISWGYPVTPNSTQMMLELYGASGSRIGLIAVSQNTSGSYTWHIPGFPQNYMCTMQYPNGLCGTNIPNGQYYIKVSATNNPFDANPSVIASAQSGVFSMTGGPQ